MHTAARRTSSLSEIHGSPRANARPQEGTSQQLDPVKASKKGKSLRRCKSNPEKIPWKQFQEVKSHEWQRSFDKERGYVTDLTADPAEPTTVQPQLSYFAYLGNINDPRKGRYQSVSISDDAQTVINLGNAIYFQNRPTSSPRVASTLHMLPEAMELQRNTAREPIKTDKTELLECCTCICCVKALFYHCTKDRDLEGNWADQPCSCKGPGVECAARWGILGILSLFMPCLCCYPVLNGCCKPCFYLRRKRKPYDA